MNPETHPTPTESHPWRKWLRRIGWGTWLFMLTALPIGTLVVAVDMLTEMPERPNCHSRFWMEQSDANRLYCAQTLAGERTPESLERAIALLDGFPEDHPLRNQSDRFLAEWSFRLLDVADDSFQAGNLDRAIAIASRIPPQTDAYHSARDRILQWQDIWATAEELHVQIENALALGNWETALVRARELRFVDNHYWARDRYSELARRAQSGRESDQKLAAAQQQRMAGSTTQWRNRWEAERNAEDLATLERAQAIAQTGTADDLQNAIALARQIIWGTAHYDQAQDLIAAWRLQIEQSEDAPQLDYARQLAESGNVDALEAAISEARRIPSYRSLHSEARRDIEQWQQQIRELTRDAMDASPRVAPSGNRAADNRPPAQLPDPVWVTAPGSSAELETDSYGDAAPSPTPPPIP